MELKFQKNICRYLNPVIHQVQNQELTQEIRLSDGMPDVGRVMAGWGQVILRSKEWRGDSIAISCGLMLWVLYQPEDGSPLRTVESWIPFQMKWDLEDGHREGSIRVETLVRFVDARTVTARKIMVRAGVAALGQAFQPGESEIGIPGEMPEDVQLLKKTYPIRLPRETGEKSFLMDEDLTLPGSSPMPEKLVYYTMQPRILEKKVTANKVVFRGSGNLHVLYLSETGQLHSWDFELPFSQFAELDGDYGSDTWADVKMGITSLELEKDGDNHLRFKCGMLAQYLIDETQLLELVEDAYSPSREVTLEERNLKLPAVLEQRTEPVAVRQSIHQDANLIADVEYLPDFPRQRRTGDRLQIELPGQFQVLYYGENGALQSAQTRWEGDLQLYADGDAGIGYTVLPGERPQATAGESSIELRSEPELQMVTLSNQAIPMVMGLELGEKKQPDPARPSLILRRAGDSPLWDIAKSTGSTVAAIRLANGLEAEPAVNQILLIPVS